MKSKKIYIKNKKYFNINNSIKMKKNYFKFSIIFLFYFLFSAIALWQSEVGFAFLSWDTWYEKETSLNSIRTYYCNDWLDESKLTDSLSIIARPWEEKEICIIQFNLGSEDIYSWWAFPENKLFSNWRWCDDQNSRGNAFAKFMKPFPEDKVKIPAKWYVIRKTTIKFPIWVKGMQYWCFAFGEATPPSTDWSMFNILVRRVNYVSVLVAWDWEIKSEILVKNISTRTWEDKKISIGFDIENKWSVEEAIDLDVSFSNMFWYTKNFSVTWLVLWVNTSLKIDTKDFGNLLELPRYKWPFKVNIQAKHKPYFNFDISNAWIDSKILAWWSKNITKSIFIFPTIPFFWLLLFILLIYLAFFKKAKIVVQQAPSQQAPSQQVPLQQ